MQTSKAVDKIKQDLELDIKKQLHWKLIKGFPNKIMIMKTISKLDIKIINVIVDTKSIREIPSNSIYNYFSGYLYERICWFMDEVNGITNINISARGNLSKKKLSDYLNSKNYKKFVINTYRVNNIKIIPNERVKLLQVADCCCSALFQALKYNDSKHYEYINIIKEKIYQKNDNLLSYGLKFVPSDSKSKELNELINYLKNEKNEFSPA